MTRPGESEFPAPPLADGEADVVLSVFGVIFASDPQAAAAELARVTAPGGRIVLSAWIPQGAISEAVHAASEAVRQALSAPAGPRRSPGTSATRSPSCSLRTASRSPSRRSAWPSRGSPHGPTSTSRPITR